MAERVGVLAAAGLAMGLGAAAQAELITCPSQATLEEAMAGQALPDGCRTVGQRVVESEAGLLCVIEIGDAMGGLGDGLAGAIADLPTEWWVPCEQVGAAR